MKTMFLTATVAAFLAFATAANATSDPRKCTSVGQVGKPAACAQAAAKMTARQTLQKITGQKYLWQGPMACASTGSLLRWRCTFTAQVPQLPTAGYVAVTYRATSTGWHVATAIVATG